VDYFDLLKRAWNITWRYKALWILGLFAGVMGGGGSSGGSSYQTGSDDFGRAGDQFGRWLEANFGLVLILLGALLIVGIALWILGVAAQGGIAHGTNEAAEGRTPALGDAWSVGFAKWGRTFMVQFVLGLPLLAIVLVFSMVALASTAGGLASDNSFGLAAGSAGLCFVAPLLIVVLIAAAFIIGIISPVAIRYGVLRDMTFGVAIKQAWNDLWAKKGLFVFWLVMLLPGIAYGVAIAIAVVPAAVAIAFLAIGEQYVVAGLVGLLLVLVLMVPNAIYATFVHSAWTLFFRKMAGLEPLAAATAPAYAPPAYAPQEAEMLPPRVDEQAPQSDTPPGDE
jgi:hypothetical protein